VKYEYALGLVSASTKVAPPRLCGEAWIWGGERVEGQGLYTKSATALSLAPRSGRGRSSRLPDVTDETPTFTVGDRVKVRRDPEYGPGPWPDEPTGTVTQHPGALDGEGWVATTTLRGVRRTYWIRFDSPQRDADGDGPYSESEVLDRYLLRLVAT
jgi:hypothetical protein